jgi:hypothetical protein
MIILRHQLQKLIKTYDLNVIIGNHGNIIRKRYKNRDYHAEMDIRSASIADKAAQTTTPENVEKLYRPTLLVCSM